MAETRVIERGLPPVAASAAPSPVLPPRLVVDCAQAFEMDQVWDVLESSGYLEETSLDRKEFHRARFFARWSALSGVDPERHRIVVARLAGRIVAAMFMSRVRDRSWMFHHFSVCRDVRRDRSTKRRICAAVLDSLVAQGEDAGAGALVCYADLRKPFNQVLYGEFTARHVDPEVASMRPMGVTKHEARARDTNGVREATAAECSWILRRAAKALPDAEAEAMAFLRPTPEPRHVLVPRAGRPACALIADPGEPGVNLFGLSSPARLVPLTSEPRPNEERALIQAAEGFFHRRGFDEFVVFRSSVAPGEGGSCESVIPGFCFTVARPAFAAWRAHIADMFADRLGPLRAVLPEAS